MQNRKFYVPEGVQDILFDDCFRKKNVEQKIRNVFLGFGYRELETPTFEYYDVFTVDSEHTPQETLFKFFDQSGRILALRSDLTIPVARVVATKIKDSKYPVKFSYISNAFSYNERVGERQKEFTQAGVEILGEKNPEADAEVIITAIKAILAAGLTEFQIDVGQVEFFKGIMEESGLSCSDAEKMRVLIDSKDFIGVERLVEEYDISSNIKDLILNLPGFFGSIDVIDKALNITSNERSVKALENIIEVFKVIEDYGLIDYVSVDLGMVPSLNYYTGTIFKGFTYGIGFPIVSGGRYDNLVSKFGKSCPAVGFSIGVDMLLKAIDRQKISLDDYKIDLMIFYDKEKRKDAFKLCESMRNKGYRTEIDISNKNSEDFVVFARERDVCKALYLLKSGCVRCLNDEKGELFEISFEQFEQMEKEFLGG